MPISNELQGNTELGHPVAIGGVGGSGTRLFCKILSELGYWMGEDLNDSLDNLLFTLIFKNDTSVKCIDSEFEEAVTLFEKKKKMGSILTPVEIDFIKRFSMKDNPATTRPLWLDERIEIISRQSQLEQGRIQGWGWKEPNTHILIDRLVKCIPDLKYIHVMRNGLDMAFSDNQNQLRRWWWLVFEKAPKFDPKASLSYWCWVHKRMLSIGKTLGENFYLVNYDNFCANPEIGLQKLLKFLNFEIRKEIIDHLLQFVKPPDSIGRYKNCSKLANY